MCECANDVRALRAVNILLTEYLSRIPKTRKITLGDFTLDTNSDCGIILNEPKEIEIAIHTVGIIPHTFSRYPVEFQQFIRENYGYKLTDETPITCISIYDNNEWHWDITSHIINSSEGEVIKYKFCSELTPVRGYEIFVTHESVMRMLELAKSKNCLSVRIVDK